MRSWNVARQAFCESACCFLRLHSAPIVDLFKLIPFSEYVSSTYYVFGGSEGNTYWLLLYFCRVVPPAVPTNDSRPPGHNFHGPQ